MFIFEHPTASKHFCLFRMTTGSSWQLPISCSKDEMTAKEKWWRGLCCARGFTRDSLALMWQRGIGEGIVRRRRGIFFCCCFDRLSYFRLCFSIREANKNKCVSLYYIHRHTENHPEQTVDISHHVCHNVARQIVGIKRSQSVRRQIRTEKSVAMRVINKDRWIKQVREMLALNKQQQNKIGTKRSSPTNLWLFEDIQSRNRKCTASQIYIMSARDFTKNISLAAWLQEWHRLSVSQSVSQLLRSS